MTDYKKYSLGQVENFLYDAMSSGATPQEIYETIIKTVSEHTEYLQVQYEKSQQLFDLLKGTAKPYKSPWDTYLQDNKDENDCMPPWGHSDLEYASKHSEENKAKSWILPVDDEGVIVLPEDLLEQTGWKEGDTLVYEIRDGGVIVRKKEPMTHTEMIEKGYTMTADGFWIMNMDAC